MGEQRNLFLAVAIAIAILLIYQMLVVNPATRRAEIARQATAEQAAAEQAAAEPAATPGAASPEAPAQPLTRAEALGLSDRVAVRTPQLSGSIALTGARIDDVSLNNYTRELDPASGIVTLLNPSRGPDPFYVYLGWTAAGDAAEGLPGPNTTWRLVRGDVLTPTSPITLGYDAPSGIRFERRIAVDENFMFTVTDRVSNGSGAPIDLSLYGDVVRRGVPPSQVRGIMVHEGLVGMFDNALVMRRYKRMQKDKSYEGRSVGGWMGITDRYWLTAVVPHPDAAVDGAYQVTQSGGDPVFRAGWIRDPEPVGDGEVVEISSYVFAGAKRAELLRDYQATLGVHRLSDAIDWGHLFFLTKPFFFVLEYFSALTHNFGLGILVLVVLVKALIFPLANMSFKSMARMRQLQPKQQEIRERYKADPQRQQKEIMALFQREKANPLAGCLPLLVQFPVFFSLYKTLFVAIEMRHAPFFGWIHDLSARDPTNIWNLFGLLPYDPSAIPLLSGLIGGTGFLAIGALPLIYGVSMAATQTLSPAPADATQQRIFMIMPWFFMFIMAPFAAGLLVYWIWNNILSFLQQYVIMRRQGVETPIGTFISKRYTALKARLASGGGGGGGASGGSASGGDSLPS